MQFIRLYMTVQDIKSKTARLSGLKWHKQYIGPALKIQGRTFPAVTGLNSFAVLS